MLSRLTIAQKVYLLGLSQLFAMMIMGGFALYQMNKIGLQEFGLNLQQKLVLTEEG